MINMSRNFNGFGMMPYRPQRDVPDYALNKNSGGIDQYGEYLEQTYGDPDFDQKRDDFLQNVSQQEQQTFGGGMNSFAPSITRQPSLGRPMFSGQVIGSPFGGSVGSPSANKSLPSSPYESFFGGIGKPNFNVHTFFQEGGSVSGPPPTHGPNANGVSNRGMFKNRDSRKKLAQMGGILSSSPELQETAMTFANGGGADLPDYIINVPGLTAEGEYLRISSATLEKLNNAVPEVMANARMVSPVEMVISEGFSSLVANARPGDAVVGTRVNRLRAQRAASDDSLVPMPPEIAQVSSAEDVFAASNAANDARDNRVARSIAAANNEDLTSPAQLRADPLQAKEMSGDPYAGDIFSDDRIRVRPRENVGGGIEAQDAANFEKEKISAALIESLAPNNAQGQPGGILGAKYPEGGGSYSTSIVEALLNSDPFSGELSPSQTARNQETLSNTLRREEIAQQREDSTEAGRIMRDAADTREAFSVPLEEPASARDAIREQLAGTYSTNLAGGTDESSLETLIRKSMPASQELESGIAKAVPTSGGRDRDLENEELARIRQSPLFKARQPMTDAEKYGSEELQAVTGDRENNEITAENYTLGNVIVDTVKGLVPDFIRDTKINVPSMGTPSYLFPTTIGAAEKNVVEFPETAEPEVAEVAAEPEVVTPVETKVATPQKVLEAIAAQPEPDADADEIFKEGVSSSVTEKIDSLGGESGMGNNISGDGSIADLTKGYVKLLKSLLGESDEDKAARKGELFMLMGAALMSGKSSNAITNIGNALQIGAKSAIQDRNTRKKRDDTIGLKGLELAVAEEGRNEAARVRKKDRTQKLDDAKDLALYRAGLKPAKEFLETPTGKLMKEVYVKILSDGLAQSQQLDVVRKNAFDALGTFSEDAQGAFRRAAMFAEQAVIGQSQTGSQDFAVDEETEG